MIAFLLENVCTNIFCLFSIQLSLWLRDVVDDLCQRKLKDIADFEWQRYIRPYLTEDNKTTPPDGEEGGVAHEETRNIVMRCLDQELPYGYEYTGCNTLPVFTPQSDNYIIALTQVSKVALWVIFMGENVNFVLTNLRKVKSWKCSGTQYN